MAVKLDHERTISTLNSNKSKEIEEALVILEQETERKKEDVRQRIEFICASLRAQGNTEINKMLKAVRQLTVKEFCELYDADTQKFLDQQKKNRLGGGASDVSRKRASNAETKTLDTVSMKRRKSSSSDEECLPKEIHDEEKKKIIPENSNEHSKDNLKGNLKESLKESSIDSSKQNGKGNSKDNPKQNGNENLKRNPEKSLKETHKESTGPLVVYLNRQNDSQLSIRLDPDLSIKELGSFTMDAPKEKLSQLSSIQKDRVREQIQDLENQLASLRQNIL